MAITTSALHTMSRIRPSAKSSKGPKDGLAPPPPTAWHAVSIKPGATACDAVRKLSGTRWLSAQAPRFPVADCDVRSCECRYRHHPDRRAQPRRQLDRDGIARVHRGDERRVGARGRRPSDD
jgi:hypothetical protein